MYMKYKIVIYDSLATLTNKHDSIYCKLHVSII